MAVSESSKIGKRGTFVIPASLRRRFGLAEGSEVIAEETDEGILIRPAVTIALEVYSTERKAEFLRYVGAQIMGIRIMRQCNI